MFENYSPGSYSYLEKLQDPAENSLELQWPLGGTLQLGKTVYLTSALERVLY